MIKKFIKWLSRILGQCQCEKQCHKFGYNSCGYCVDNHKPKELIT